MRKTCWALLLTAPLAFAADKMTGPPLVVEALNEVYSSDYKSAQTSIGRYITEQPEDPLGYAVRASTYLFSELDRMNILESEFFESDSRISDDKKKVKPDPATRAAFYASVEKAQSIAQVVLDKNPNDPKSLFIMCFTLGETVDYVALIEKKQLASLSVNKRAYRTAKHLLEVDPTYIDAHLTTGFTEYVIGNLPSVVRWFVKFDDVKGNKAEAFQKLQLVAKDGNYLRPLAKILLAAGYLREKKPAESQKLLGELVKEYPSNPLIQKEYAKVTARVKAG